jgi:hypothetical protein
MPWDVKMKRIAVALLVIVFSAGSAYAQSCETKAVDKDGKALTGAAKTSFMKKCCEEPAVSEDGKPLVGAAKTSHIIKEIGRNRGTRIRYLRRLRL